MASNDEYQHLRFWEDEPVVIRCYCVEQEIKRSRPALDRYITAPLDPVAWTKSGDGWEFKTK